MGLKQANFVLLAGGMEARLLADRLLADGCRISALMSEAPRGNAPFPVKYRLHPEISGVDIVSAVQDIDAIGIIDASHGFDAAASRAGVLAADVLGLPIIRLARPLWQAEESPRWQRVSNVRQAMPLINPGARVFAATGWKSLSDFADFKGAKVLLRRTHQAKQEVPFDFVEPVHGAPPFTVESEMQLFEGMGVDLLICRNLGGAASRPKLDAALRLGLNVILVDPPKRPFGLRTVFDLEDVMRWAAQL